MIVLHKKQLYFFLLFLIFICSLLFYCFHPFYNFCSDNSKIDLEVPISNNLPLATSSIDEKQEQLDNLYKNEEKVAYLTFDDGPTKIATPKILDILKKHDVKATFFVIGYRTKEFPELIKREYEEGHLIGNHGYSHKNKKLYASKSSFSNELLATDQSISEIIGIENYHSNIFRFPNGSTGSQYKFEKQQAKTYLKELGYCYVDWNALNNDSIQKCSSSQLVNNLKKSIKGKDTLVILMHDTCDVSKSYTALEDSIIFLKEQGYTFKTFKDILDS